MIRHFWLSVAACAAALPLRAEVPAALAQEMIETLLGQTPSRYASDLAAMRGQGELYLRLRSEAEGGTPEAIGLYYLWGHIAIATADAGMQQAYSADIFDIFGANPDASLSALAGAPWLLGSTCFYLGNSFSFEDRQAEERPEAMALLAVTLRRGLDAPLAKRCTRQLLVPTRPEF